MTHSPEGFFIILSEEEANVVWGVSGSGHALEPRRLRDGRFILGE